MAGAEAPDSDDVAGFVREYIWPRLHVVIDVYIGGDVARFALVASFHPVESAELPRQI